MNDHHHDQTKVTAGKCDTNLNDHYHDHQVTAGKCDAHLNGVDSGDLAAASIEVLLEVRQEDPETEKKNVL